MTLHKAYQEGHNINKLNHELIHALDLLSTLYSLLERGPQGTQDRDKQHSSSHQQAGDTTGAGAVFATVGAGEQGHGRVVPNAVCLGKAEHKLVLGALEGLAGGREGTGNVL